MVAKVRALAVCLWIVFLPLVVKGGEPEPFSFMMHVESIYHQYGRAEPYAEVAVYSAENPGEALFQGFTSGSSWLHTGMITELPQSLYIEVKRDRVDGTMHCSLPLVRSNNVLVEARQEMLCSATYNHDEGVNGCQCRSGDDLW